MNLFDEFPSLSDDKIIIGKMSENDVGSLEEITRTQMCTAIFRRFFTEKAEETFLRQSVIAEKEIL